MMLLCVTDRALKLHKNLLCLKIVAIFIASNVTLRWYLLPYIKIFYMRRHFPSWDVNHMKLEMQTIAHAVSSQRKAREESWLLISIFCYCCFVNFPSNYKLAYDQC